MCQIIGTTYWIRGSLAKKEAARNDGLKVQKKKKKSSGNVPNNWPAYWILGLLANKEAA
jgi:hypothetical protein